MKNFYHISLCKWILIFSFLWATGRVFFASLTIEESAFDGTESILMGEVVDYEIDGDKLSFTLRDKEKVIGTYFIKTEEEKVMIWGMEKSYESLER